MTQKPSAAINRRTFLTVAAAATSLAAPNFFVRNSWAAGKTIQIGSLGWRTGRIHAQERAPRF